MKINLKAARVNKGLTQKQAAKLLDVHPDSVRRWESGRTSPKSNILKQLSKIYDIDLNDLIF